ncbi:DNA gyrase inhibitor YacG [Moraxella sp.]|uniref:DNA gyrase inhibitor YacG n=1 Tax=Moraxella sp. TaxID=479 RepID=UPI00262E5D65|nr:DNA gyrase inhibitor YacG [Moraxella sp.]MCP3897275.1 DNA gyrase inhibitor YacG [Moraxella sp.]
MNHPKMYPCPTCKTPTKWQDNPTKPFCSKRCQLIDLGEWASENYKIASSDTPFSDELNDPQSSTIN